ncbi:uncharacterized protein LOC109538723 [Dendroctonus ponderosae]|uniref:uncharacterized protein LOC109538723 n=1 Tax=Dendroctonus ponderosae TaxID=77166 RepID=UPI0020353E1F|nr:uncharacterized protein LOC109538723 [Dendroctonus ponderosae]KAH1024599.1 hypothetical protein HUJ05_004059 [Dendroctonus ponderosae]
MLKRAVKISEDSESLGSCTDRSKSQDNVSISTVQLISQHNIYKEVIESHMPIADITSFEAVEPVEKDRFISDRFSYFKKNLQDMASIRELEKPLFINSVRIQPGCMIFKDAYDGKSFNQTITITNRGKFIVNIRISPPTSKAFKIKPILIPHVLSPGLSIVKRIQYLYTKPTAIPQACMDIFVNNDCLRYELLVCKTIFNQSPRLITSFDVDYDLSPEQKILRDATRSYYLNYVRSLSKQKDSKNYQEKLEDYLTTNHKKLLMENERKGCCDSAYLVGKPKHRLFIPLTPYEIHNLVVTPKFIQLGKLAADSECSDHFKIENRNTFPIHISIKALYPSIRIEHGEFILGANEQKNIDFIYHSDYGGNHHIPMFVIMNFFHVIDLTVLATIVANTVRCLNRNIFIVPTEKTTFLELANPINSDVSFEMDTKYFHLEAFPSKGIIPAKRKMTITVTFNPEVGYIPIKEIAVISESGFKELIEVHFEHKKAVVSISRDVIEFRDVPLNTEVRQELIIQNKSDQLVPINIELEDSDLFPELEITPMKALLWQKADVVISITLKMTALVDFKVPIKIRFQHEYSRDVTIKGNVVYPVVSFRPELIKIPKVPSGSTVSTPFKIYNNCNVSSYIQFAMEDYPEFTIRTKFGENITNAKVSQSAHLLLPFNAYVSESTATVGCK